MPLGDLLEGHTLVVVSAIEDMPDRPDKIVETADTCHEKSRGTMIHDPWRFEFDAPTTP